MGYWERPTLSGMTELDTEQIRVLGCLLEKERTVPDSYPMTLNGLVTACNQSSNRFPVVNYDPGTVQRTLDGLKDVGLVRFVHPSHGERTTKYRQVIDERLALLPTEAAVLAVLFVRGAQTVAPGPHVVEEEHAGRRRVQTHLAERLRLLEPGHARVQHELEHDSLGRRVPLVELADKDDRVGVRTVRDERLRSVEHVLVAVAARRRLHRAERVRAGVRFGDRPRADLLERLQFERPPLLLRRRALAHDRGRGEPHRHSHGGDHARAVPAQLDDRQHRHCRARTTAVALAPLALLARLLGLDAPLEALARHRVHAERGEELAQDVVRRQIAVLELVALRDDLGLDELADGVPDHLLLFGPLEHA